MRKCMNYGYTFGNAWVNVCLGMNARKSYKIRETWQVCIDFVMGSTLTINVFIEKKKEGMEKTL